MDKLYRPEKFPCTKRTLLKEYFSRFAESYWEDTPAFSVPFSDVPGEIEYKPIFGPSYHDLPVPTVEELESITSISLLERIPAKKKRSDSEEKKELKTTKTRKLQKNRFPSLKGNFVSMNSYADNNTNSSNPAYCHFNSGDEFALLVRVYHPFEFNYKTGKPNGCHNIKFSHEIVVLGSNTLAQLRDKILCFNDSGIFPEVQDPFSPLPHKVDAKKEYPSGFIFIDNVFYNDFRDPRSIDYSDVIIKWATKNGITPLETFTMEDTRVDCLQPRFGYPYVYMHQGNCEHLLVFTDAWLLTTSIKLVNYPSIQGIHRFHSKLCILCNDAMAQWMILNCDRLPHARSFVCTECMLSYLYKDGKKVTPFTIYQFYDQNRIIY